MIRTAHGRVLANLLGERIAQLKNHLAAGVPSDYALYRQLVGEIKGLTDALELSKQADMELSGNANS